MNKTQLAALKKWFAEYVAGFYTDDEYLNANIELKHDHTHRTCRESRVLAEKLNLSHEHKLLAEAIALLHDVGRFEQFTKYRTYSDPRSVNHCTLGVEIINRHALLDRLNEAEQQIIKTAVELHGTMQLPEDLDDRTLLFCRLIRDADKIDILYVVTEYYKQYAENPNGFKLELELPEVPEYTQQVLQDVLAGRRTDYGQLRTMNDMKLVQLGWVYDINFAAALQRIKELGLLEKLASFLPSDRQIETAKRTVFNYITRRIKNGNKPV